MAMEYSTGIAIPQIRGEIKEVMKREVTKQEGP